MSIDLTALKGAPRLLVEAELRPVQGTRFQPTGFPNLGAARYQAPSGAGEHLLVESAQSMANRLEAVCWDAGADKWVEDLEGLPFVKVKDSNGATLTNSVHEAHRLNSPYIEQTDFFATLKQEIGYDEKAKRPIDFRGRVYPAILKFDPNSLVHGFFLESIAGVIRAPRVLSAFIEAENVRVASSGGVKNDRVDPKGDQAGGGAKEGFGNVPFARDEFVAERIVAYFNLDLAQIRSFGLISEAERLILLLSLYKVTALLEGGLRLRTACDLELTEKGITVTRPHGFTLPKSADLGEELKSLIPAVTAKNAFADPAVTEVVFTPNKTKKAAKGSQPEEGAGA